jgi:hypothetical protein
VNLDMTPPAVDYDGVDGTSGANGWYTSPVTVRFSATDALSGVAGDRTKTVTVGQGDGVIVDSPVFSDLAGNQATLGTTHSDPLKIDTLAPNAPTYQLSPAPNAAGWNHEAVIVHFVPAGDNGPSGVARCTDDIVVNTEGADQTFTGTCTDTAGNVSAKTTATVNLDETGPTNIQFAGAVQDGGSYYYGAVPAQPTCSATDTVSGVTGCVVSGDKDPGAVGSHTYTATATNGAGLTSTEQLTYTVLGWTAKGFYAPVNMGGVWNTVKNGSTVPLKFEVFTDHELTDTSVVSGFTQQPATCPGGSAVTDPVEQLSTTGGTSLRYDTTAGQFVQNWQTPKKPGACFTVTATLRDGSAISAGFMLK